MFWPCRMYRNWTLAWKRLIEGNTGTKWFGILRIVPFKLFNRQHHKMVKHTQTIRRQKTTNYLSVFDHFLGFALKGLSRIELDFRKIFKIVALFWKSLVINMITMKKKQWNCLDKKKSFFFSILAHSFHISYTKWSMIFRCYNKLAFLFDFRKQCGQRW